MARDIKGVDDQNDRKNRGTMDNISALQSLMDIGNMGLGSVQRVDADGLAPWRGCEAYHLLSVAGPRQIN